MPFTNRHELKYILMSAFYLGCNFIPFFLPLFVITELYFKHGLGRITLAIAVLDYLIPLRPGPNGYSKWFSNLCDTRKGVSSYHDAEIVVEGDYQQSKNYLVCYFPHALFGTGGILTHDYVYKKFGMRFLFTGADIIFYIPLLRRAMTCWGCTPVSAKAMKQNLTRPYPYNILQLQPDGIRGMFYGIEHEQVLLQKRKGFCRIALETGAHLIPCYVFGANDVFRRKFGPDSVAAKFSQKMRVSLVYWIDRFGIPFGCVPVKTKMVVALGAPIPVNKTDKPTQEQIDVLHATFVKAIKDLFDRYKHKMGAEWAQTHDRLYLETEELPSSRSKKAN
jgi:1-acyl-sn-glycerol-3-phosphate acyltransferase